MGQTLPLLTGLAAIAIPIIRYFFSSEGSPPPSPTTPPIHVTNPAPAATISREEMIAEARAKLGLNIISNYNFAICGQAGSGKSSLVNALRGVHDSDILLAAPVGETETTMEIKPYPHPKNPHVVLWDLPGAGTASHPSESYFYDKTLYAFDCLIIVTSSRFTQIDISIASQAVEWGIPVVFVRQKFNADFDSRRRRERFPENDLIELLRKEMLADIRENISQVPALADRSIYLISAWRFLDPSIPAVDEARLITDVLSLAYSRRNYSFLSQGAAPACSSFQQ